MPTIDVHMRVADQQGLAADRTARSNRRDSILEASFSAQRWGSAPFVTAEASIRSAA